MIEISLSANSQGGGPCPIHLRNITPVTSTAKTAGNLSALDKFFEITKRGSTVGKEIRGGVVTFFAMAYIVVLNPIILGGKEDIAGQILDPALVGAATSLAAGFMSILFGVIARLPFAFAAGLGMNSFLAVNVVGLVTWQEAMGIVVINGLVICLLGATGARLAIYRAVPASLKAAISVAIGFFIAFIGFVNAGFVTRTPGGPPVQLGTDGSIVSPPTVIFVLTLILAGVLVARRVNGAILIALVIGTIASIIFEAISPIGSKYAPESNGIGWESSVPTLPEAIVTLPDFSLVGQVDVFGSFARVGIISALMLLFTLVFTNFFDAIGTMNGLSKGASLQDQAGEFPRIKSAFLVEGVGAVVGGATSSSSTTVFVESAAGIGEGARTGLASITTGVLLFLTAFFTPLTALVPIEIGSAALVLVGTMMMSQVTEIEWSDFYVALPAFLTIAAMPLTYSIANGIGVGFVSYVLINLFGGRAKRVHPILFIVAAGFILFFTRGPLESLLS
ncbi:NCS2 family permease [Canibacter zhoujuaniae]|uniref:NCS2 family permease n=1 Tax=Canibacter zhoujuaniae TaxID=2708343 RepID=UPI0014248C63